MVFPLPGDYIDIHSHGSEPVQGIFAVENLMAHEERIPGDISGRSCTFGIHPWHLEADILDSLLHRVRSAAIFPNVIALGETGFDKLRGPAMDIQLKAFEEQILISEIIGKPVFIHCVRARDQLLPVHKRLKPKMPWMVHGFRGNPDLARQLLSRGLYLSFWFDFALRPESSELLSGMPRDRIFLETDGSDLSIVALYNKVAADLKLSDEELKSVIHANFSRFFQLPRLH
jgi:TatD DNase family protein